MARIVPCLLLSLTAATVSVGCEINTKIDADGTVNGPKNVGQGGDDGGSGGGDGEVTGAVALGVTEVGCVYLWTLSGESADCSGCDLAFEVSMQDDGGDCGDGGSFSGPLEFNGGAAYFRDDFYWGQITQQGGGTIQWYTYDYVYGAYYSYRYAGYAYY